MVRGQKIWFNPGSNRRPPVDIECETDVITNYTIEPAMLRFGLHVIVVSFAEASM